MILSHAARTVTFSAVGFLLFIIIVVVWRVVTHDASVRKIRFGIFWEREREGDEDEPH